ncbi:hypothetical protein [Aeromicrobium marinum]|uniref:hypothetical protein n=1 Tax=Aeromicrobium marinum TaxID=219314 RepID=UPI00058C2F87|nr:hypothetical protein [Aeromicrobium marinum]
MSDPVQPPKKVVRRVVRKTVVRPGPGTPVPPAGTPRRAGPGAPTALADRPAAPTKRPPRPALRDRLADGTDRVRDPAGRVAEAVRGGWYWVVDSAAIAGERILQARLPVWPESRAAAVSGLVAGLIAVAVGGGVLEFFSSTRGVSTGGAWGVLAFLAIAVLCIGTAEALLRGFAHPSARLVAFLGTSVAIVVVLMFFIDVGNHPWAAVIIPVVATLTHLGASVLVEMAEQQPDDEL